MSTKPKTQSNRKKIEHDLAAFEKLSEETKELMQLKEEDEKASGHEQVVTTRKIHDKSRRKV
jgi:hypothetical protein